MSDDFHDEYEQIVDMYYPAARDEDELAIERYLRDERDHAPRKVNNQRRQDPPAQEITRVDVRCTDCNASAFYDDYESGARVCTRCGLEAGVLLGSNPRVPNPERDVDNDDHGGVACAQRNYWHERRSQWLCQEPGIPAADRLRLLETYRAAQAAGPPAAFDPFMPKHECRRLVIMAGLNTHVYVEKWLTIRRLVGAPPHPIPDDALLHQLDRRFYAFLRVWLARPDLHPGRKAVPNVNFLMHQFLLLESLDVYHTFAPWFPITANRFVHVWWERVCRVLNWPVKYAEYTQGDTRVFIQSSLSMSSWHSHSHSSEHSSSSHSHSHSHSASSGSESSDSSSASSSSSYLPAATSSINLTGGL